MALDKVRKVVERGAGEVAMHRAVKHSKKTGERYPGGMGGVYEDQQNMMEKIDNSKIGKALGWDKRTESQW
jgi:hypothetical protein